MNGNNDPNETALTEIASQIRATCLKMAITGKHGHLSSSLCYVDILTYLYCHWLDFTRNVPDKFILSKGHGCTSLYAAMAYVGQVDKSLLANYARPGAAMQCHPCVHALPQLENSSGSLGQGLGIASGMALAQQKENISSNICVLMGDGECNEGAVWEAAMFIAARKLNQVIAIVDYNGVQAVGFSDEIMGHTRLQDKFSSFGWDSHAIDGNDFAEIHQFFSSLNGDRNKPVALIANTRSGIDFIDKDALWHYRIPSDEEYQWALLQLSSAPMF